MLRDIKIDDTLTTLKPELRIVFRKSKLGDLEFIDAVFVDIWEVEDRLLCYSSKEQHSSCQVEWLFNDTTPCYSYDSLYREIRARYKEHNLIVLTKLPPYSEFINN